MAAGASTFDGPNGIHIFIALGQMGASVDEISDRMIWLFVLAAVYGATAGWRLCRFGLSESAH